MIGKNAVPSSVKMDPAITQWNSLAMNECRLTRFGSPACFASRASVSALPRTRWADRMT